MKERSNVLGSSANEERLTWIGQKDKNSQQQNGEKKDRKEKETRKEMERDRGIRKEK